VVAVVVVRKVLGKRAAKAITMPIPIQAQLAPKVSNLTLDGREN
jgi:hypothetical protein